MPPLLPPPLSSVVGLVPWETLSSPSPPGAPVAASPAPTAGPAPVLVAVGSGGFIRPKDAALTRMVDSKTVDMVAAAATSIVMVDVTVTVVLASEKTVFVTVDVDDTTLVAGTTMSLVTVAVPGTPTHINKYVYIREVTARFCRSPMAANPS